MRKFVRFLQGFLIGGAIGLADVIRLESREAVIKLKGMGVKVMMLTGDSEAVARWALPWQTALPCWNTRST